ncbi:hypothetical protein K502DRAFT_327536 [Neoconidiobolus thromboides FSU 785]|nr:hypothetical protein K502DRAFT_327536 [Neoconidiobolus thromboides FSU 785]
MYSQRLFVILFALLSLNSILSNTLERREGCLSEGDCRAQQIERCSCDYTQQCVIRPRSCWECQKEECIPIKDSNKPNEVNVALIASTSVGSVIVLILIIGGVFYFRNKKEIEKHGGIHTYVRYRANRDSIIMMTGDEDVELLNKRLSMLSLSGESQRGSVLLTTKKHNFDTNNKQKAKVIKVEQDIEDLFEPGTIIDVAQNGNRNSNRVSLFKNPSFNGSTHSEVLIAPTSFQTRMPTKLHDKDGNQRPVSIASFQTEILENPYNLNDSINEESDNNTSFHSIIVNNNLHEIQLESKELKNEK